MPSTHEPVVIVKSYSSAVRISSSPGKKPSKKSVEKTLSVQKDAHGHVRGTYKEKQNGRKVVEKKLNKRNVGKFAGTSVSLL
jgi:hypothetical protein